MMPSYQAEVTHHKILITQFKFVPAQLSVKSGDTVTWINQDMLPHNITAISYKGQDKQQVLTKISLDLMKGDKFTTAVTKDFEYLCGFHPSMQGAVTLITITKVIRK